MIEYFIDLITYFISKHWYTVWIVAEHLSRPFTFIPLYTKYEDQET